MMTWRCLHSRHAEDCCVKEGLAVMPHATWLLHDLAVVTACLGRRSFEAVYTMEP